MRKGPKKTPVLNHGNVNNIQSGFSLIELIVVMFILSVLAFFTIPLFKAPDQGPQDTGETGRHLARFIETLKHQAVREQRDYRLHLDLVAGRAWALPEKKKEGGTPRDRSGQPDTGLQGLSLSGVAFPDQEGRNPQDTTIRVSHRGISDMALIHMNTKDGSVTLRLHPFIYEVEIIQGNYTFNDCL
ncbi:MAG: prepilin-type N-terminal cleavage/methylation domain-containing protein [Desulfobacter sp.]|nr:MAG: prepilin-type N-terminal cleavage/methylation domain-containing protein [Desulfobacter sp.]